MKGGGGVYGAAEPVHHPGNCRSGDHAHSTAGHYGGGGNEHDIHARLPCDPSGNFRAGPGGHKGAYRFSNRSGRSGEGPCAYGPGDKRGKNTKGRGADGKSHSCADGGAHQELGYTAEVFEVGKGEQLSALP